MNKNIKTIKYFFTQYLLVLFLIFAVSERANSSNEKNNQQKIPSDANGGIIAYSVTYTDGTNQIYVINADGSGNTLISNQSGRPLGPSWSPDASRIVYYNHMSDTQWSLFIMNSDGTDSRQLTKEQKTLDWNPSWAPDGKKLIFTRSFLTPVWRSELWTILPDGSGATKIAAIDGQGGNFSPDGSTIVYFNYIDGGGDIWVIDSKREDIRKLTDHPAEDWWPHWSPDGKKIVFQSKRDGNFEIYVMNSDGSGLVRLTKNNDDDEEPKWSPDGTKIAFSSLRDGHYEIYIMSSDGTGQKRLTNVNGQAINPCWKPLKEPNYRP